MGKTVPGLTFILSAISFALNSSSDSLNRSRIDNAFYNDLDV